ncbi:spore germination lipoprotein GerD [Numidum massiliense]|uniref:spore germination lipoprotein GerD n=1 Tax=Numidum massiliense TaxID=1522315 RepID=UPI0006D5A17A|nr:spore germination lipoprotein GerD [Numidum massiliense]
MRTSLAAICIAFAFVLTSCSPQSKPSGSPDYQETKQMVVDILKTEDGKKAIQDAVQDPAIKEKVLLSGSHMTEAVDQAINNPKNKAHIEKIFQNPKVAANFAKTIRKEHEQLLKQLMKDPDYQKMLLDVMKNPDYEKQILDLMKSEPYRKQTMTIMNDALQNPLFKEKYMELLLKATEETLKSEKKKGQK